jgi:hypothetical protein
MVHGSVEVLAVVFLPWATKCDIRRLHTDQRLPLLHGIFDKFSPVVGSYMCRWSARDEQFGKCCQIILASQPWRYWQRQKFPPGFIDDRWDAELADFVRTSHGEVMRPQVPLIFRPQVDTLPSLLQSLLRFGCFCGILRPSRRLMRSIHLRFTCQPASRSKAVTWR